MSDSKVYEILCATFDAEVAALGVVNGFPQPWSEVVHSLRYAMRQFEPQADCLREDFHADI